MILFGKYEKRKQGVATWCEKFHMKQKIDLGQKTINNKNYSGRLQVQIVSLAYT